MKNAKQKGRLSAQLWAYVHINKYIFTLSSICTATQSLFLLFVCSDEKTSQRYRERFLMKLSESPYTLKIISLAFLILSPRWLGYTQKLEPPSEVCL